MTTRRTNTFVSNKLTTAQQIVDNVIDASLARRGRNVTSSKKKKEFSLLCRLEPNHHRRLTQLQQEILANIAVLLSTTSPSSSASLVDTIAVLLLISSSACFLFRQARARIFGAELAASDGGVDDNDEETILRFYVEMNSPYFCGVEPVIFTSWYAASLLKY